MKNKAGRSRAGAKDSRVRVGAGKGRGAQGGHICVESDKRL